METEKREPTEIQRETPKKNERRKSKRLSLADALKIGPVTRDTSLDEDVQQKLDQDIRREEEDEIVGGYISLEYLGKLKSELGGWESATNLCDALPGTESLPIPDIVAKSIDLIRKKKQEIEQAKFAMTVAKLRNEQTLAQATHIANMHSATKQHLAANFQP
jgi:hypothetical protein